MSNLVPSSQSHALDLPRSFMSDRGVTIGELIEAWLHSKDQRSHSPKTQRAYRKTIEEFRAFLQSYGYDLIWKGEDFMPMIADFAQAFAATRSTQSHHKGDVTPATQNQRLAILSSFYLYAIKRKHISDGNPIDAVERPSVEAYAQAQAIERDELVRRLQTIDATKEQGIRDLALLTVLLSTGRRVSEVAALTRKDVQISGEQIKLSFRTKGAKNMRDTLSPDVSLILGSWLAQFYAGTFWNKPENTPVWVNVHHESHRGEPLGYHGIAGVCKHYLGTSKVHTTRHTFAILMEIAGAKLTDIQQRLGHKNAATTGIYMNKLTVDRNTYAEKLSELLGLTGRFTPDD